MSGIPHVYQMISELATVKDIRVLKNTNFRTIGYLIDDKVYGIKTDFRGNLTRCQDYVNIDLSHVCRSSIIPFKPYLIFGVLCVVCEQPMLTAKIVKLFDESDNDLALYHQHQLLLRKKSHYFQDLLDVNYNQND